GQLIDRVAGELLAGTVEERNKLATGVDASATTLTFTYPLSGLREGSMFEIGSEQFYVWTTNSSAKSAVVERGFNGTTATSHSAEAITTINPRFPRSRVLQQLNADLADLSSPLNGLFQVKTVDIAYNGSDRMVNITGATDIQNLIDVRYRYLSDDYPIIRDVRLLSDMPTSDFASGFALAFDSYVRSGTIRVVYRAPYGSFSAESDTVADVGGSDYLDDVLALGTQMRLMAGREVKRNFTESQGDTRRAEEVPSGAVANSMLQLQRLRRDRVMAEAARLNRQYPLRIRK
ncbi:MAG: hypothetical protein ACO3VQ_10370, partial [Ilumatobacteraceae bacterium]